VATRLWRGPFEVVDDGFVMRVRNAEGEDVRDVTIRLRDGAEIAGQAVGVLRPGQELSLSCPGRLFSSHPAPLEIRWRWTWSLVSQTVMV
jgi:hypothetical protein